MMSLLRAFRGSVAVGILAGLVTIPSVFAQSRERYEKLQSKAAELYSEQSYALAHEAWSEAAKLDVPEGERRLLDFYLADSLWRSHPDSIRVADARRQLEKLAGQNDGLGAEAMESLGDSWLALEGDWDRAWEEYQRALKFWAAATEVETARPRYLGIVWKATGPPDAREWNRAVPVEVLANALDIAPNDEERARAHFFLGAFYARDGDAFARRRALREFQAAVDAGSATAVYEEALFRLAWLNLSAGKAEWQPDGQLTLGGDDRRALELFRRFVSEFPKGRSSLSGAAAEQIEQITRAELTVEAAGQFLPGTRPRLRASWRNVGEVTFTLSRVDLLKDFHPTATTNPERWLDAVAVSESAMINQWKESDAPKQSHALRSKSIDLDAVGEPGTYLVEARSGELTSRALVVVTEGAAIFNDVCAQAVAFFCAARTGDHAEKVAARLWQVREEDRRWKWTEAKAGEARDGLVRFEIPEAKNGWGGQAFLLGRADDQPSVTIGRIGGVETEKEDWRIQVFTDRAAYRPEDTVRWKLIARRGSEGAYRTPAGELVSFVITDPNGNEVNKGEVKLTEFGGAWGELGLKPEYPLGEYEITFGKGEEGYGSATLFRLEEYRLPEFKVNVAMAPGGGHGVRLGDDVEAKISTEYYFGGAVADAEVEIRVEEENAVRPLPWEGFRERVRVGPGRHEPLKVIKQETVRTGPDGIARIRFQTPVDAQSDRRYSVEARVTDSSGREVVGRGSLVVGRQGYFAELKPARRVIFPGDKVDVAIETKDGNNQPTPAKGILSISRQRWSEVWRDPKGNEMSGEALDRLRRGVFPPEGESGWRLVRQEYVNEEIAEVPAATDRGGHGNYQFRPEREGFYRLVWSGPDADGPPVTTETNIWVSSKAGSLIGYHSGGVEIIVDPATPAANGKVPVLITADTPNRDVLLLVHGGENLFRTEVLHLDGDSKLIELDRDERFVPNVFVSAATMRGLQYFTDTRAIEFPPVQKMLKVEMRPGADNVLPGQESTFDLKVKDAEGRPVRGEFALGVSDEAIAAIQEDYAGDPVKFFWGEERGNRSEAESSVSRSAFFVAGQEEADKGFKDAGYGAEFGSAGGGRRKMVTTRAAAMPAALPAEAESMEMMVMEEAVPEVSVRANFSATAFWNPRLLTNDAGEASVKLRYPDSLTTWKAVLRGMTRGSEFGFAEATTRTTLPLIARLQAPRFLTVGDKAQVSGVINNRTGKVVSARVDLEVAGLSGAPKAQMLRVAAEEDARAEWTLEAAESGNAKLTLRAVAAKASDGMQITLPVVPNGIQKTVVTAGKANGPEATWKLVIPAERVRGSESLVITATPSLAATAIDALPYLVSYPYGCVEQTMSRFLPAAVTARTLQSLGLDRGAVAGRIYGGVEPEFLAKTHPSRMDGAAGLEELDLAIKRGMARLVDFQHADGAWGWWKDDDSDPFMTAYVVWGLRLAQQAGVPVRSDLMQSGADWLRKHLVEAKDDPNLQAWLLHALAVQWDSNGQMPKEESAALENLWKKRDQLTAYGRALFALSAHAFGETAKAKTLVRNLRDGVQRDPLPGSSTAAGVSSANSAAMPTAHWGSDGLFRQWQDGGVESTAFALQALLVIEPTSDLVGLSMNWLVKNRRGAQWSNTRDTAIALLALNRYLAVTRELGKPATFELSVNGKSAGAAKNATALDGLAKFVVDPALLRDGENEITLRGDAANPPIYMSARAGFFTLEQPIPAAGNEIFVKRDYALFSAQPTLLDGYRFDRVAWKNGEAVDRDQRVEVTLTIEAKNDLEYVLVEDLKPAGLEAVNVRSGEEMEARGTDGKTLPVHCELRDRKVALFLRRVPQGVWAINYELRTETAGSFSALPVMGEAMYAPEIRGNGEGRRVEIR